MMMATIKRHARVTPATMLLAMISLAISAIAADTANADDKLGDKAKGKTTPPNVVIIFIDDLGYADIGPFGATKQRTPNLDRMSNEGMRLTSFYAAPVCSVSRAQLLTGCYGARVSVPGVFGPASKNGLHPNELTIAERLRELGYATMCVGKWHLGDQPEFLPTRQGFDHYFGIPYSNDMQRRSTESGQNVVPLLRDDKVIELLSDEDQSRIVERSTEEAVDFIRRNRERPFFLYMPHTAVHTPIWPGEKFRGKSSNGRFGDWVEEVDWSVGRILDTLRESKLAEQTLVVFTSDNGPWLVKGPDGGSALPLRGGKGSTWEGGVRVPTLAWWPGKIAPASRCDAVAGTIDLLPTAVAIAGGETPAGQNVIDGRDLTPLLMGQTDKSQRDAHFYFAGYNIQAIRQGPWKLAITTQPESMGTATREDAGKNPRLYNLDNDIGEQTDVAENHPELVTKLRSLIDNMQAEIGGTEPTARRPAGEVAEPKTLYPSDAPRPRGPRGNPNAPPRPPRTAGKPITPEQLARLRVGDRLPGESAPKAAMTPLEISCTVATTARDGIILAHGGSAVGYALHLREGKLLFAVRNGNHLDQVAVEFPNSDAPVAVIASLDPEGKLRLKVGDLPESVAAGRLLSRQPQEALCVGLDDGVPVTDYSGSGPLVGRVEDLRITTP
jgi:arylsulfatase A-like enzyme